MTAVLERPEAYGLLATPPVRWLIDREPEVKRAIQAFIRSEGVGDTIDVAGPAPAGEAVKARRRSPVRLPTVRLRLRIVSHHLTGEPGVEVTCSDEDCDEIVRWHNQARARALLSGASH